MTSAAENSAIVQSRIAAKTISDSVIKVSIAREKTSAAALTFASASFKGSNPDFCAELLAFHRMLSARLMLACSLRQISKIFSAASDRRLWRIRSA